jgi:hypothetical protein
MRAMRAMRMTARGARLKPTVDPMRESKIP